MTVYGIPLFPSVDASAPNQRSSDGGDTSNAKRKQRPSTGPSPKRQRVSQDSEIPDAKSNTTGGPTLIQRSEYPGFNPTRLEGAEAQEWRQLVLDSMFPPVVASTFDEGCEGEGTEEKTNGKRKGKDKSNSDAIMANGSSTRPSNKLQIPMISKQSKNRRLPSALDVRPIPRLCYVCIGPRMRGKFDGAKAKELGIPNGQIRKRLIDGEAITFSVSDGQGGTIERTVRPEEVVEPSETPKVRPFMHLKLRTDFNYWGR